MFTQGFGWKEIERDLVFTAMHKASQHILILLYCIRFQLFVVVFFIFCQVVTQRLPPRAGQMALKGHQTLPETEKFRPTQRGMFLKSVKGRRTGWKPALTRAWWAQDRPCWGVVPIKTHANINLERKANMNDEEWTVLHGGEASVQ